MAESSEPGRRAAAGGESLDGEEDEEREPLLPRIAWAPPRKGAPGTAVRLVREAGEAGAASRGEADDQELLLRPAPSPRCPSRGGGLPRSSPTDLDWSRSVASGAPRLCPAPRGRPRSPPPSPVPAPALRLPSLPHSSACLVRKAVSWPGIPAGRRPGASRRADLGHRRRPSAAPPRRPRLPRGCKLLHLRPAASPSGEPTLLESDTGGNLTL